MMDLKTFTQANRQAWNEVTLIRHQTRGKAPGQELLRSGGSVLDQIVTSRLAAIPVKGKKVAHLCCHNGSELISMVNLGAIAGTGFDISDEVVLEADMLAKACQANCRFIRTDIYDIGSEFQDCFDLAFVSAGTLPWLPDLDKFFAIAAKILKQDGLLLIYEMHPILYLFAVEDEKGYDPANRFRIAYSYFRSEPWIDNGGFDFAGSDCQGGIYYSFTQTLSEIITATIRNGMRLEELTEYPHDISGTYKFLEQEQKLPLSYMLVCRKAAS